MDNWPRNHENQMIGQYEHQRQSAALMPINRRFKSLWAYQNPPMESTPSCIMLPPEDFVMKYNLLPHLPTFYGEEDETPYTHISDFKAICRTVQRRGASLEISPFITSALDELPFFMLNHFNIFII